MIKMNDFEQGLANIMGSFMEVNLDCVEKQNQEIDKLQNNWNELKKWLENLQEYYISMKDKYDYSEEYKYAKDVLNKMQELEGKNE